MWACVHRCIRIEVCTYTHMFGVCTRVMGTLFSGIWEVLCFVQSRSVCVVYAASHLRYTTIYTLYVPFSGGDWTTGTGLCTQVVSDLYFFKHLIISL